MLHSLVRSVPSLSGRSLSGLRLVGLRFAGLSTPKPFSSAKGKVSKAVSNKLDGAAARNVSETSKLIRAKKYPDGCTYEGSWKGDVWTGEGKLTSATGQVWVGEFKDGKIYKGSGVLVFPDGDLYEGKWVNGKMEGQGKSTQTDGSYLKGEFKSDTLYDGTGVLVNPDGTVLQGIW